MRLAQSSPPPHLDPVTHPNLADELALELAHFNLEAVIFIFELTNFFFSRVGVVLTVAVRAVEGSTIILPVLREFFGNLEDDSTFAAFFGFKIYGRHNWRRPSLHQKAEGRGDAPLVFSYTVTVMASTWPKHITRVLARRAVKPCATRE